MCLMIVVKLLCWLLDLLLEFFCVDWVCLFFCCLLLVMADIMVFLDWKMVLEFVVRIDW